MSFIFKPVCFAALFTIGSWITNLNGFDQKTVNRNIEELMEISKAQTITCERCVCVCVCKPEALFPVVES